MSFQFVRDPAHGPAWQGVLPGGPEPYVLRDGEGEHANLFGDLFSVLVSADETGGQFGVILSRHPAGDIIPAHTHASTHEVFCVVEGRLRVYVEDRQGERRTHLLGPGDVGYVPAGLMHAYRAEQPARVLGVVSGGFERAFEVMGTPTDDVRDQPPFVPDIARMQAVAAEHGTSLHPGVDWPEPAP